MGTIKKKKKNTMHEHFLISLVEAYPQVTNKPRHDLAHLPHPCDYTYLKSGAVDSRWQLWAPSVGHYQHFVRINLWMRQKGVYFHRKLENHRNTAVATSNKYLGTSKTPVATCHSCLFCKLDFFVSKLFHLIFDLYNIYKIVF